MMFCTMYGSMYQLSLDMSYSDAANVICPDAVDSRFDMIKDNITDDMLTVHEKILRLSEYLSLPDLRFVLLVV